MQAHRLKLMDFLALDLRSFVRSEAYEAYEAYEACRFWTWGSWCIGFGGSRLMGHRFSSSRLIDF